MKIRGTDFVLYEVSSLEKSIPFYRDILGLTLISEENNEDLSWAEFDATPTTLSLYAPLKTENRPPNTGGGTCIMLAVDDAQEAVDYLKSKNVPVTFGPFETKVCFIVEILDPDGNKIGLHQRKDGTAG